MSFRMQESALDPRQAAVDVTLPAGQGWTHELAPGDTFRIVDLEGNQAVDTLFFNSRDVDERYSATETIRAQGNIYLSTGTRLMSSEGRSLLTIVADTCGRHDTLGGACSAESNQVRYALDKKYMHNCRDSFLLALARYGHGMGKRDLPNNINFFMNVPVTPAGEL
ncbi:MAG TPA: urea carboxylase-associated family protein, partial [Polyangia bacterium]